VLHPLLFTLPYSIVPIFSFFAIILCVVGSSAIKYLSEFLADGHYFYDGYSIVKVPGNRYLFCEREMDDGVCVSIAFAKIVVNYTSLYGEASACIAC